MATARWKVAAVNSAAHVFAAMVSEAMARAGIESGAIVAASSAFTRLMREEGLRPKQKRRFRPATTNSRHPHPLAVN